MSCSGIILGINTTLFSIVVMVIVFQSMAISIIRDTKDADHDFFVKNIVYYSLSIVIDAIVIGYLAFSQMYSYWDEDSYRTDCLLFTSFVIFSLITFSCLLGVFIYGIPIKIGGFGIFALNNTVRIENEEKVCYKNDCCMELTD